MIRVVLRIANGEGRIRTSVGIRRQIYSLLPLATRVPLRIGSDLAGWSRWSESNRRPADYKSAALPLSYIGGPHHRPARAGVPDFPAQPPWPRSGPYGTRTTVAGGAEPPPPGQKNLLLPSPPPGVQETNPAQRGVEINRP